VTVELGMDGGDHARMAMAEDEDAEAAAVEILGPFFVPDPRSLRASLGVHLHELGEARHPLGDMRAVAGDRPRDVRPTIEIHGVSAHARMITSHGD
jgi:hypothetical protein